MHDIYTYKQKGLLYFWKYTVNTKNYPGFQMSWENEGKSSFIEFLELLRQSSPGSYRTLSIGLPSEAVLGVPNNRPQKVITRTKLRIALAENDNSGIVLNEACISLKLTSLEIDTILDMLRVVKPQNELSIRLTKQDKISFWW